MHRSNFHLSEQTFDKINQSTSFIHTPIGSTQTTQEPTTTVLPTNEMIDRSRLNAPPFAWLSRRCEQPKHELPS